LPRELWDEQTMAAKMAPGKPFEIVLDGGRDYVEVYTEGFDRLTLENHSLDSVPMDFGTKQLVLWCQTVVLGSVLAC